MNIHSYLKEEVLLLLPKLFELKKENLNSQIINNNEFIKGLIDLINTNKKILHYFFFKFINKNRCLFVD